MKEDTETALWVFTGSCFPGVRAAWEKVLSGVFTNVMPKAGGVDASLLDKVISRVGAGCEALPKYMQHLGEREREKRGSLGEGLRTAHLQTGAAKVLLSRPGQGQGQGGLSNW